MKRYNSNGTGGGLEKKNLEEIMLRNTKHGLFYRTEFNYLIFLGLSMFGLLLRLLNLLTLHKALWSTEIRWVSVASSSNFT